MMFYLWVGLALVLCSLISAWLISTITGHTFGGRSGLENEAPQPEVVAAIMGALAATMNVSVYNIKVKGMQKID